MKTYCGIRLKFENGALSNFMKECHLEWNPIKDKLVSAKIAEDM